MLYQLTITLMFILQVLSSRISNEHSHRRYANNNNSPSYIYKEDNIHTITISGKAAKNLPTNLLKVVVSITTLNDTVSDSFSLNNDIAMRIDKLYKALHIPAKNITTTNYKISAIYDNKYVDNVYINVFKGYEVKNEMEVCLSNITTTIELIGKSIKAGANEGISIDFSASDRLIKAAKDSLLSLAAKDALKKVKMITDGLGLRVVDIKSVSIKDAIQTAYNTQSQANTDNAAVDIVEEDENPSTFMLYKNNNQQISMTLDVEFIVEKKENSNF